MSYRYRIGYALLTIIKFFTGIVREVGDPTTRFVVKAIPTLRNTWSMGEETAANIAQHSGTWYYNREYWTIAAQENGFWFEPFYYFLVLIWWPVTIGWLVYQLVTSDKVDVFFKKNIFL